MIRGKGRRGSSVYGEGWPHMYTPGIVPTEHYRQWMMTGRR